MFHSFHLSRTIHTKTKFVSKVDIDNDRLALSISFLPTIQVVCFIKSNPGKKCYQKNPGNFFIKKNPGNFFNQKHPPVITTDLGEQYFIHAGHMQVTRTDLVKPSAVEFLADIGGSMGFWLGLGVLQVADIVVNIGVSRCV